MLTFEKKIRWASRKILYKKGNLFRFPIILPKSAFSFFQVGNGHVRGGAGGGGGDGGKSSIANATTDCNIELVSALAALQEERRRRETERIAHI